jgi:hypothetical protein
MAEEVKIEKETIDYEAVLVDLREKRIVLDQLIRAFEVMSGFLNRLDSVRNFDVHVHTATPPVPQAEMLAGDTFFGMSIPDAIKKFLRIVKKKQSVNAITKALEDGGLQHTSKSFYSTVFTVLKRLETRNEVVKVGKDWGLVEWYPGLRKLNRIPQSNVESGDETA